MLVRDRDRRRAGERHLARQHLVQHHAQRVDVAARVDRRRLCLLGREVLGRSKHHRRLRHRVAGHRARDAEVRDFHRSCRRNHDVRRLDVAVDDPVRMREREAGADVGADLSDALGEERPFLSDDVAERLALDVLHHDVVRPVVGAGVVHAHDVGMVQCRRVLRFPAETLDEMGVPAILSQQRLDRDRTPQDAVFPQENLSHPARTELISQLIAVGEDADVVRARTHVSPWTDRRHRPFDPSRRRNGSTPPEVAFSRWKVMASSSSPRPVLARSTLW